MRGMILVRHLGILAACAQLAACTASGSGSSSSGDNNNTSSSSSSSSTSGGSSQGGSSGVSAGSSQGGSSSGVSGGSSQGGGSSQAGSGSGVSSGGSSQGGGSSSQAGGSSSQGGNSSSAAPTAPPAPAVSAPEAAARVVSPLLVTGPAFTEPYARPENVRVTLRNGSMAIIEVTQAVTADLPWQLLLTYTEPAADTALTLEVQRINAGGASTATSVPLVQAGRAALSVTITQAMGTTTAGSTVHVAAFADPDDVLNPVATALLAVSDGAPASGTVELGVPTGSDLYLRAFRDTNGDGHPNLETGMGAELQSGTLLRASTDTGTPSLELREPPMGARYSNLNATTENSLPSERGCGGYQLTLSASAPSDPGERAALSPVTVQLPDGRQGQLQENQGCAAPDELLRTIPEDEFPGPGNFLLGYRNTVADFVDVTVDHVAQYVRMPLMVVPTSPTGAAAVAPGAVTVSWEAVPGANFYEAIASRTADGMYLGGFAGGNMTTFTTMEVADGTPVRISIRPQYVDENGESDAWARTSQPVVVTVASAANTLTLSGAITNDSGRTGRFLVEGGGCELSNGPGSVCGVQASVVLPETATSYTLTVLRSTANDEAFVEGLVMAQPTEGMPFEPPYTEVRGLDGTASSVGNVDLVFSKPVVITSPLLEETVDTTPVITWADWDAAPGGEPAQWSYVMFAIRAGDDFPAAIRGMPRTQLSFDFAAPGAAVDLLSVAMMGTSVGQLTVGPAVIGVGILPCEFGVPSYNQCFLDAFMAAEGGSPLYAEQQVYVLVE